VSPRRWPLAGAAALVALSSIAWLDPHARTREGNRLFAAGKYDEAASTYNEQLVDHPDSPLLHFNLGDAQYKQGKYDEALAAFAEVHPGDDDRAATARAAYNTGNADYRLGEAIASSDPKAALDRYAQALVAYRRAITAAPTDVDAKLNYELVEQKRAELQKKLEEQQKQQKQQQGDKQQDKNSQGDQQQQKNDQQQQGDQQQQQQAKQPEAAPSPGSEQQQAAASPEPQPAQSPNAGEQGAPSEQAGKEDTGGEKGAEAAKNEGQEPSEQAGDSATSADDRREGEMTRQEAAALLDAQRSQEVQPGEVVKRVQGAGVAEPAQDW
jgi:Ca-activated chloride channel family protein